MTQTNTIQTQLSIGLEDQRYLLNQLYHLYLHIAIDKVELKQSWQSLAQEEDRNQRIENRCRVWICIVESYHPT